MRYSTVEDTQTTFEEIEKKYEKNQLRDLPLRKRYAIVYLTNGICKFLPSFGPNVLQYVKDVTDDKTQPKHMRKIQQVEHAAHISRGGKLVKLADKLCVIPYSRAPDALSRYNLRDLLVSTPEKWDAERIQGRYKIDAPFFFERKSLTHSRLLRVV